MLFVGDGTRRDNPYNIARNHSLCGCGIFKLFADCHLFAHFHKLCYVCVRRVVGHAAHRRTLFKAAVPARQSQIKQFGRLFGIVKKHLVKIAESVKNYAVLILFLYGKVMAHHR